MTEEILEKMVITNDETLKPVRLRDGIQMPSPVQFKLDEGYIEGYKNKEPDFGFNGLGELTYMIYYSRKKDNGEKENWYETCLRVVNGTYTMQKEHILNNKLHWDEDKAQQSASQMFRYMFDMKFLPPGRGLWAMGTDIINKKGLYMALNNCAFTSTKDLDKDPLTPFLFMMDASMLGTGVGFDTKGAGKVYVSLPPKDFHYTYTVPDTREGWVESLKRLLETYLWSGDPDEYNTVYFDYSMIRDEGEPLKTFGGTASGYKPLENLHEQVREVLDRRARSGTDSRLTERDIVDIMNMIGECVKAGNIRRSAQIAFGETEEFAELKDFSKYPERSNYGRVSNNSIIADGKTDYLKFTKNTYKNGEPGYFWLRNAREFGRMGEFKHTEEYHMKDWRVMGGNPCLEQSLEHMEMCCLVEVFPTRIDNIEEFFDVLKYAYLYAKTVTLGKTHWKETNDVMLRNRRIGTSVTGIAQFIEKRGLQTLRNWLKAGYWELEDIDKRYSEWLKIPQSNKRTSVKPSGTVSLLAGVTPGVHYPTSQYYIRRVTIQNASKLHDYVESMGIEMEAQLIKNDDDEWVESETTSKACFPVYSGMDRTADNLSMWEQLEVVAFMQEYWADNQVSATVYFDPEVESPESIARALEFYQYRLKGISMFPRRDLTTEYPQLPYEDIDRETYERMKHELEHYTERSELDIEAKAEKWCNNDTCIFE